MHPGRQVGVMYACRACSAGNGHEAHHCHACGANLGDAVPMQGAAGDAFHREVVGRHRQQSLGLVLAWLCPLQAILALLGAFPWYGILGHALWAGVVIALVARFQLGSLRACGLGAVGSLVLVILMPGFLAAAWLPVQAYLYAFAGGSVRTTNDLTT